MKSRIKGVQSLYCTWDHVGYDHGRRISQKTVVVLFSNEKTCSQTSCTSVYNQYQFGNKVDLSYCSADNFLLIISKRPRGAVTAVVPVVSVDSLRFNPSFLSFMCTEIKAWSRTAQLNTHHCLTEDSFYYCPLKSVHMKGRQRRKIKAKCSRSLLIIASPRAPR